MARKIVRLSEGNLRKAILTLEATKVQQYPFLPDQEPQRPNWQLFVQSIAQTMVAHQTPLKLMEVRGMLYELLSHCIPAALILRTLVEELLPMLDSQLKFEVIQWAAFYEHRLHIGTKEIFHLEGFVAKFMHIYKEFLMTLQDF